MILKQGLPWSVMGTRIYGRDLLPIEIFRSKYTWSRPRIAGVPMDSDMRVLMEPTPGGHGGERMGVVMYRYALVPTYSGGWTDNPPLDSMSPLEITVPPSPQELHWDIEDDLEDCDG